MHKLKLAVWCLVILILAGGLYLAGSLFASPKKSNADTDSSKTLGSIAFRETETDKINLAADLSKNKLPEIRRIIPVESCSYKLLIGDSALSVKDLSWIDETGKEILSQDNFYNDLISLNKYHYKLLLNNIDGKTCPDIYDWHKTCVNGKIVKKDIILIAVDSKGNDKARWEIQCAWPTKYKAPDFNAKGNDVAIETLEIEHEGIERIDDDDD